MLFYFIFLFRFYFLFFSYLWDNYRTLLITVLFIRTDRLSCINIRVIIIIIKVRHVSVGYCQIRLLCLATNQSSNRWKFYWNLLCISLKHCPQDKCIILTGVWLPVSLRVYVWICHLLLQKTFFLPCSAFTRKLGHRIFQMVTKFWFAHLQRQQRR